MLGSVLNRADIHRHSALLLRVLPQGIRALLRRRNRPTVRLLYLSPTAAMGGAERVLLDLLTMVREARPSWTVGLISGNDGPLIDDARALGVTTTTLPFPRDFARLGDAGLVTPATWARFARHAVGGSLSTLRYVQQLRAAITGFSPDVVHSNGIKMHVLGALVRPSRAALVWHFHDYPGARPVTSRLVRGLKSRCSSVVAVSDSVATDIRRELPGSRRAHHLELSRSRALHPRRSPSSISTRSPGSHRRRPGCRESVSSPRLRAGRANSCFSR